MTVRCKIEPKPVGEDLRSTRAAHCWYEWRVRRPKARRRSGATIAAEAARESGVLNWG
jgi:hypothetical protein